MSSFQNCKFSPEKFWLHLCLDPRAISHFLRVRIANQLYSALESEELYTAGKTTGYIPIYDWTQAIPSLSYAGNTYNINLQMYNSPVRLVPVPLNEQVCLF